VAEIDKKKPKVLTTGSQGKSRPVHGGVLGNKGKNGSGDEIKMAKNWDQGKRKKKQGATQLNV